MGCHFTEEVSQFVDGELAPREAARLGAHIEGCAACKQDREAFLLLRRELRAYDLAPDPHAQGAALAAILGSRTSEGEDAAPSAVAWAGRPTTPRGSGSEWLGSLAEAFGVRRLRPAHVATLALLLIGTVLGARWFMRSNTSPRPTQSEAPAVASADRLPVQADEGGKPSAHSDAVNNPTVREAETPESPRPAVMASSPRVGREESRGRHHAGHRGRAGLSRDRRPEAARVGEPTPRPSSAGVNELYAAGNLRAAADPALRVGRHAERVERLLRSFRNARLTQSDPTLDVADARRLSKRLLYNNIALRREAAGAGDLPVEGLLDSVEPILLDISNLPNAPSQEAVGSIKERIDRRQLIGVLQARGMVAAR